MSEDILLFVVGLLVFGVLWLFSKLLKSDGTATGGILNFILVLVVLVVLVTIGIALGGMVWF